MAKLVGNIANKCRPVAGLKSKIWLFNRVDFALTKVANTVTAIAKIGAVVGYTAQGTKSWANAGHDGAIFENLCTAFIHKLMANLTVGTAAQQANIDQADDLVAVVEGNDGVLYVLGVDYGLWKTSQSNMLNDNNALTAVEFTSRAGMEEEYSMYFYTGTVASLDALLV